MVLGYSSGHKNQEVSPLLKTMRNPNIHNLFLKSKKPKQETFEICVIITLPVLCLNYYLRFFQYFQSCKYFYQIHRDSTDQSDSEHFALHTITNSIWYILYFIFLCYIIHHLLLLFLFVTTKLMKLHINYVVKSV